MELTLIWGPTSTGKTAASVELALATSAPVIALDRFQGFDEITTGSGRPRLDELKSTTRIYLAQRKLSEGLLLAAEAHALLKARVLECAQCSDKIILEGGSVSILNAMISDPFWAGSDIQWVLHPFHIGDTKAFFKKAHRRVHSMFYPEDTRIPSLLDELVTCWRDTQLWPLLADIDGYRAAIAFSNRKGYSIPQLQSMPESDKAELINEIAEEYLQHAIWQQETMEPIPSEWHVS